MASPGSTKVEISVFGRTESGRAIALNRDQLDNLSPEAYLKLRKLIESGKSVPDVDYENWYSRFVTVPTNERARVAREKTQKSDNPTANRNAVSSDFAIEYPLFQIFGGKYHTYADNLGILCELCKLERGLLDDYCPGILIPREVVQLLLKSLVAFRDGKIYGNDGNLIGQAEAALDEAHQGTKSLILDRFMKPSRDGWPKSDPQRTIARQLGRIPS